MVDSGGDDECDFTAYGFSRAGTDPRSGRSIWISVVSRTIILKKGWHDQYRRSWLRRFRAGIPRRVRPGDSEYEIVEWLRPHYRRTAELDRVRVIALRLVQSDKPFEIPRWLWPPGAGMPDAVDRGRGELFAQYFALRDADAQVRAEAVAEQAYDDVTVSTCSCMPRHRSYHVVSRRHPRHPRPLAVWRPAAVRPCAALIRRGYRARLDADADGPPLEDIPVGARCEAASSG